MSITLAHSKEMSRIGIFIGTQNRLMLLMIRVDWKIVGDRLKSETFFTDDGVISNGL